MDELVADLSALGYEVVVNGEPDDLMPSLKPLPSRLGSLVNSLPSLVAWLLRMLLRWRRDARRGLKRAGVEQILVWDEVLALLCRLARPRGVRVVWVVGPPEGSRIHQRALRAAVARSVDRVVTSWHGEKRFADAREVVVPLPLPPADRPRVGGWVVFGSARATTEASLQRLRQRAAREPASALVFNARDHDTLMPAAVDALVAAANPSAVWWVGDDEWVMRLGGVPNAAVDPSDDFDLDHRHLRVLGAGAEMLVSPENRRGLWEQVATASADASGWKRLALVDAASLPDSDYAWARHAFGVRA